MAIRRARMSRRPTHPRPPTESGDEWEVSLPASYMVRGIDTEWRVVTLGRDQAFMMVECLWNGMRFNRGPEDDLYTDLKVTGTVYLPEIGWHMLGTELALGHGLLPIFQRATRIVNWTGQEVRGRRNVGLRTRVEVEGWREFRAPMTGLQCRVPRFMIDLEKMASEEEAGNLRSKGSQGTDRGVERNEGFIRDRESAKPEGTEEDGKDLSTGESSGKVGGSKRGPQENKEGRDNGRSSPRNSEGTTPKKTKVSDACRKLAEIEKRTAAYKARLIEEMVTGNERDLPGEGSREQRRAIQGEVRHGGKDNSHRGTPSKKGKEKGDSPTVEAEKATTPPAIDSGASRLPATPKVTKGCAGLWSLRERVLGWFDSEGTPKAGEKQRDSKEGEGTSKEGEGEVFKHWYQGARRLPGSSGPQGHEKD
ncbi:hypothetical protein CBR_g30656 [Chara braunii]|uniref:Uncharacterized protein n=1 Tax=Chara braunii TaxID=69332 RepID=A0A388LDA8_CHABU|nr:hypothetical protein CBR_g30656 [Chara braunii]|eukprot:GBG80289.1 hypothetical protein CBR_g30656 [Chara braunii]